MGEMFKAERLSLVVGLAILSVCLLLGWLFVQRMNESPLSQILTESFLILGWVAIWKPSETFSTFGLRLPPAGNFSTAFPKRPLCSMASPLREGSSGMIAKPHDNSQSDTKLNDHWELKQGSRDFSRAYFLLSTVKCGFGAQKSILARVIESASCRAFRPCHKFDNALHRPRDLRKSSRRIAGGAKAGASSETAEQRYKGTTRLFLVVRTWCRRSCPTA
jgi:hypothetical protein